MAQRVGGPGLARIVGTSQPTFIGVRLFISMLKLLASLPELPWYTGVSIIIALFALWIGFRNYRISARKAKIERDAALGRNLSLIVYAARVTGHGKYDRPRHFILGCRFSGSKPVIIPFMCEIENLGQKSGSNVELVLRLPGQARWTDAVGYTKRPEVTIDSHGEDRVIRFAVGECNPGERVAVMDFLVVSPADFQNGPVSLPVEFRFAQRDEVAVEGELSVGLIDISRNDAAEALAGISAVIPIPERPRRLSDRLLELMWRISEDYFVVGTTAVFVFYEKEALKAKDSRLDRVPSALLKAQTGVRDRQGRFWFPSINSRRVLVLHGKVAPEVAGFDKNKVPNLGTRRIP